MLKFKQNIISNLFKSLPVVQDSNPGPRPRCREYTLNKEGYRCDDLSVDHNLSVVTLGCSNSFGWKLDEKYRFSNLFVNKLSEHTNKKVANWNLSLTGKSNDFISRMTMTLPSLKPDILLVQFTALPRREYFDINFSIAKKGCYDHISRRMEGKTSVFKDKNGKCPFPQFIDASQHMMDLASPHEDMINFYKNYMLIEMTCQIHNIQMLYTCSLHRDFEKKGPPTNKELYVGYFNIVDRAEDNGHPGIKSNQLLADKFWSKYKDVYLAE